MTPDEKRLVDDLFRKLDASQAPVEDGEADTLIRRTLAEHPSLAYRLVQHSVLQDIALGEAQRRIADLESRSNRGGGSFLGRFLGGGSEPPARSAPPAMSRGWGGEDPRGGYAPPPQARAQARGGSGAGSFLRSAATTAAGVAAGGLLFNGLEHLFGGDGFGGFGGRPEEVVQNDTLINEYTDPAAGSAQDAGGWPGDQGGDPLAGAQDPGGWSNDPGLGGNDPGGNGWDSGGLFGGGDAGGDGGWDGSDFDQGGGFDSDDWS